VKIMKSTLKQIIKEEIEAFDEPVARPVHDPRVLSELQTQTTLLQQILAALGGGGGDL
jgi:hypothetical protein